MILVDNFRIFVLVVGLCGTLIRPSDSAATCLKADKTEDTCTATDTHACGINKDTAEPAGCVEAASACPAGLAATGDAMCDSPATKCCCNADKCNDFATNKGTICKEAHLATLTQCGGGPPPPPAGGMKCLNEKEEEMDCTGTEVCGIEKEGTTKGCIDPGKCGVTAAGDAITCEGAGEWCCCKGEKCDTKALACALPELKDKGLCKGGASEKPGDTTPGGGEEAGSERSAVTLSVGSLVAIASVAGLSHRISSGA